MSTGLIFLAPVPAVVGSLLLMNFAQAPKSILLQQLVVTVLAISASLCWSRFGKPRASSRFGPIGLVVLTALSWLPLVPAMIQAGMTWSNPHRWIALFGFPIYIGAVVLPLFLLLWQAQLAASKTAYPSLFSAALATLALLLQPDAAQLTAFSFASLVLLLHGSISMSARFSAIALLFAATAIAWTFPDPLLPVDYVEGVFALARQHSTVAFCLAAFAVALPVLALLGYALNTNPAEGRISANPESLGLIALACYFSILFLLAPLKITPVPFLGFGASSILGYFLAVSFCAHQRP